MIITYKEKKIARNLKEGDWIKLVRKYEPITKAIYDPERDFIRCEVESGIISQKGSKKVTVKRKKKVELCSCCLEKVKEDENI